MSDGAVAVSDSDDRAHADPWITMNRHTRTLTLVTLVLLAPGPAMAQVELSPDPVGYAGRTDATGHAWSKDEIRKSVDGGKKAISEAQESARHQCSDGGKREGFTLPPIEFDFAAFTPDYWYGTGYGSPKTFMSKCAQYVYGVYTARCGMARKKGGMKKVLDQLAAIKRFRCTLGKYAAEIKQKAAEEDADPCKHASDNAVLKPYLMKASKTKYNKGHHFGFDAASGVLTYQLHQCGAEPTGFDHTVGQFIDATR